MAGDYLAVPLLALRMANPLQMWNCWLAHSTQAALLGWEAQRVVASRLMRIAPGGGHRAGKKALNVYGKRVRANRRRLSRA